MKTVVTSRRAKNVRLNFYVWTLLAILFALSALSGLAATPGLIVPWGNNGQGQAAQPPSPVVTMAAGDYHNLGITPAGTVVGWGDNGFDRATPPAAASPSLMVAAGGFHSLSLTVSGKVVAWGENSFGQGAVPTTAQAGVISIAAGANHNLALLNNGRVFAWGEGSQGQVTVPANVASVTAVAAGAGHSMALSAGRVAVWGDNSFRQRSDAPAGSAFTRIAAGANHCLALRSDGALFAWGDNSFGQTVVPPGLTGIIGIAAGGNNSMVLLSDHTVRVFGDSTFNQNVIPSGLTNILRIAVGAFHILALRIDPPAITSEPVDLSVGIGEPAQFTVQATGSGPLSYQWKKGAIDLTGKTNPTLSFVTAQVGDSADYSVVINNDAGTATSRAAKLTVRNPPVITSQPSGTNIAVGGRASFIVQASGSSLSYRWRKNKEPITGASTALYVINPVKLTDAGQFDVVITNLFGAVTSIVAQLSVFPGAEISVAPVGVETFIGAAARFSVEATNVQTYQWFFNEELIPGATGSKLAINPVRQQNLGAYKVVVSNQYGGQFSGAVPLSIIPSNTFSEVIDWGESQIWNGSMFVNISPPLGMYGIQQLAPGKWHQLALRADGNVIGWGDDAHGEAYPPSAIRTAKQLAAGDAFSLALLTDGKVVGWGKNDEGQTAVPSSLVNVIAISAGQRHSLALRQDGTIAAWGNNSFGQSALLPGLGLAKDVQAGTDFNVVLLRDGTTAAWGNNSAGQSRPPSGLSHVASIAAGRAHALALLQDGTVVAWGDNSFGQSKVPTFSQTVTAIAAGADHSAAILADGTVKCWGKNNSLQIDPPSTLIKAIAIAASGDHSIALQTRVLKFQAVVRNANGFVFELASADGLPITAADVAKIIVESTSQLTSETQWSPWSGTLVLANGILKGTGSIAESRAFLRVKAAQ